MRIKHHGQPTKAFSHSAAVSVFENVRENKRGVYLFGGKDKDGQENNNLWRLSFVEAEKSLF